MLYIAMFKLANAFVQILVMSVQPPKSSLTADWDIGIL